jgi:hypothetical protein
MKKSLLISMIFLSASVFAVEKVSVQTSVVMRADKSSTDSLNISQAKCGFIQSNQFRCIIPVVKPLIAGLGEPRSIQTRLNTDGMEQKYEQIVHNQTFDVMDKGKEILVDIEESSAAVLVMQGLGIKWDLVEEKRQQIGQITVTEDELRNDQDNFRLKLQKQEFAPIFQLVTAMLNDFKTQQRFITYSMWDMGFNEFAEKEMVELYCKTSNRGRNDQTCKALELVK